MELNLVVVCYFYSWLTDNHGLLFIDSNIYDELKILALLKYLWADTFDNINSTSLIRNRSYCSSHHFFEFRYPPQQKYFAQGWRILYITQLFLKLTNTQRLRYIVLRFVLWLLCRICLLILKRIELHLILLLIIN